MSERRPARSRQWFVLLSLGLMTWACASARADTVWVRANEKGGALPYQNVRVEGLNKDGELVYTVIASGRQATKALDNVSRIHLVSDPQFSAAEEAFDQGDFKKAAAGYQKVVASSAPAWVKDRAGLRLIEAASQTGDFAAAVTGYLAAVGKNAELAKQYRPKIPANNPQAAAAVVPEVERAAANTRLAPTQRQMIELFLVDLYRAANQNDKAAALVDRMTGGTVAPAARPRQANEPAMPGAAQAPAVPATAAPAGDVQAGLRLRAAALALEQKDYPKALAEIDAGKALFSEPRQQADALYYRAEALANLAKDDKGLADAALAYMRVVAHFKDDPAKPHVADALLKTAGLQERLKALPEALALYEQTAQEFAGTPAAEQAQQGAARLKGQVQKAK